MRETSTRDAGTRDASTHGARTHDARTHDPSTHDPSTHDARTHDPSTQDPSTRDASTHDASTRDAVACLTRARECLHAREFDDAELLLRQAITQDPQLALAYELLGKLLYRDARAEESAAVYRAWLQAMPSDPIAAHLVAATGGAAAPERASDGFVTGLFERAAPDFDTVLASLGYQTPQLVFESAGAVLDPGAVALDVLDLGCGTGLCGGWFRPIARRIVGVDLSPGMLERARARGCYDELVCDELTAYVRRCEERFDLITAADVFCYFGDLTAVFAATAALLRPGGRFIFSLEELTDDVAAINGNDGVAPSTAVAGFALLEHGRYAHSAACVEQALRRTGLAAVATRRGVLRFERGAPVQGLVTAAGRAAAHLPP
jgi:predicted TPR repeat methyltransferase